MSINVVKLEIPNLDFWLGGVKRSQLPAGTRFKKECGSRRELVSINVAGVKIPGLDFWPSGVKRS